ncbi:unnamed protein product [Protopolystoma xenopodis]|uniref:Uncharacterized protein n=1 Tax=Protopolystoma xenopodis TaxID=117903 RepID=A0A448XSJ7_9PLAT|nr:unnamed protein product [Protopolystoma xenopodis]
MRQSTPSSREFSRPLRDSCLFSTPILAASRDFHFSTATPSQAIPSNQAQLKNIDFGGQPMLTSPVCQLVKEPEICLIISDEDSNEEEKIMINKGNKNKCSSSYLPGEALGSCKQQNAFRKVLESCLSPALAESNITTGDKNNQDVGYLPTCAESSSYFSLLSNDGNDDDYNSQNKRLYSPDLSSRQGSQSCLPDVFFILMIEDSVVDAPDNSA